MQHAWTAPKSLSASVDPPGSELVAEARAATSRAWVLFLGEDAPSLAAAAAAWIAERGEKPLVAPPSHPPLPITVHGLTPPGVSGERILCVERIDRAFFDTLVNGSFAGASPLYLLPKLATLAAEGEPLGFVATASASELEARAPGVLEQKGLASRFEIRRVPGAPASAERPGGGSRLDEVSGVEGCLARGLATRDPKARARAYLEAIEHDPASAVAHAFLASSLLERRRATDARDTLERAVALDPGLDVAHYELGRVSIQTDDLEAAAAAFRRAAELLPDYPSAWGNLGAALGELQRLEEASEALERAVALDPLNAPLLSNLGVALRDRDRLEEAEGHLRAAVALSPDFVFGHYNLAGVLYLEGRYPEAIEAFETARSMDPSRSPRQSLLLAIARLAAGDRDGALEEYRDVFGRLEPQMRADMRTVAEWDLKQLARRAGVSAPLKDAARWLRTLA